jgi:hypothetical protein
MTLGVASQTARAVPSGRGSDLGLDEHPGALSQVVRTSDVGGADGRAGVHAEGAV